MCGGGGGGGGGRGGGETLSGITCKQVMFTFFPFLFRCSLFVCLSLSVSVSVSLSLSLSLSLSEQFLAGQPERVWCPGLHIDLLTRFHIRHIGAPLINTGIDPGMSKNTKVSKLQQQKPMPWVLYISAEIHTCTVRNAYMHTCISLVRQHCRECVLTMCRKNRSTLCILCVMVLSAYSLWP